nr:MAG TPA: hypothetical protein [Caudoviricetes sp.]
MIHPIKCINIPMENRQLCQSIIGGHNYHCLFTYHVAPSR